MPASMMMSIPPRRPRGQNNSEGDVTTTMGQRPKESRQKPLRPLQRRRRCSRCLPSVVASSILLAAAAVAAFGGAFVLLLLPPAAAAFSTSSQLLCTPPRGGATTATATATSTWAALRSVDGHDGGGTGGGDDDDNDNDDDVIPITILSGFLGSGKTTLLTQLLQNKEGLKIAVVVNDVASVNIDSKLLTGARGQSRGSSGDIADSDTSDTSNAFRPDGLVELQNGCACCSLSDELLMSVSRLVTMSDLRVDRTERFQHIVIELSGIADPKQVRAKFQEASFANMPLMDRVRLDTLITVVDVSMFETYFASDKSATRKEAPELFRIDDDEEQQRLPPPPEEEEWMKDMPPQLLEAVMAGLRGESAFEGDGDHNGVADLLVSQVETADVVVLNKCDLADAGDGVTTVTTNNDYNDGNPTVARLREIVGALNPRATLQQASYGKVPLASILAVAGGLGVAASGAVDDHRDYVAAAMATGGRSRSATTTTSTEEGLDGSVEFKTQAGSESHDHSHGHEEEAAHSHSSLSGSHADVAHGDGHDHGPDCTDETHSHSHSHSHQPPQVEVTDMPATATADQCADPTCNDPGHSHVHSHAHAGSSSPTTPHGHAGIGTFVYRARRPFHPGRLVAFLKQLPVVRGIPDVVPDAEYEKHRQHLTRTISPEIGSTLKATLRSKGFLWCADSHTSAMYWSQAGASFELTCLGQWWATLPREQWPPGIEEYVLQDFDDPKHIDEGGQRGPADTPSSSSSSVGDRRQELVFIGPQFDSATRQRHIQETLDRCLLTPDEYQEYKSMQTNEEQLQSRFANAMEGRYVNF